MEFSDYSSYKNDTGIWEFFLRQTSGQSGKCKMCHQILVITKGSTGSLHNHLSVHRLDDGVARFLTGKKCPSDSIKQAHNQRPTTVPEVEDENFSNYKNDTGIWQFFLRKSNGLFGKCKVCNKILIMHKKSSGGLHNHLSIHRSNEDISQFLNQKETLLKEPLANDENQPSADLQPELENESFCSYKDNKGIWQFYLRNTNGLSGKCKLCNKVLIMHKRSTGCLHNHLSSHRSDDDVSQFLSQKQNSRECGGNDESIEDRNFGTYKNDTGIWYFFLRETNGQSGKCKTCSKVLAITKGSTGCLHKHLIVHRHDDVVAHFLNQKEPYIEYVDKYPSVNVKQEMEDEDESLTDVDPLSTNVNLEGEEEDFCSNKNDAGIWQFFNISVECKICNQNLTLNKGSPGSLHNHLSLHCHNEDVAQFLNQQELPMDSMGYIGDHPSTRIKFEMETDTIEYDDDKLSSTVNFETEDEDFCNFKNDTGIWEFFLRQTNGQSGKCKMCNKILNMKKGSTGSLHNHLSMHRRDEDVKNFLLQKRARTS